MSPYDVEMSPDEFRILSELISERCGMTYEASRTRVLERRLRPLMLAQGCRTYRDYYYTLRYSNNGQVTDAIDAVVNNETYFFREAAQIRAVADLVAAWTKDRPMRILSAGCSTGEEPYSVAILLHDDTRVSNDSFELVAIDVSSKALAHAADAAYDRSSFRGEEGSYHDWHFVQADGTRLRLSEDIRKLVQFRQVNLIDDESLRGLGVFDAILCRNVLIYFKLEPRKQTITSFHSMLRPGGHLFLGHSESLNRVFDQFELVRVCDALAYRKPDDTP